MAPTTTDQPSVFDLAREYWPAKFPERPFISIDEVEAMSTEDRAALMSTEPVLQADVDALTEEQRDAYHAAMRRLG